MSCLISKGEDPFYRYLSRKKVRLNGCSAITENSKEELMQAVVFHEHGGPEVLRMEDMPQPTPGPGEVLLRVRAIAVNRTLDCEVRARPGAYGSLPMPHILGSGPAGEVA